MKNAVLAEAAPGRWRYAARSAAASDALATPLTASTNGCDSGSRDQDSSPSMARVVSSRDQALSGWAWRLNMRS